MAAQVVHGAAFIVGADQLTRLSACSRPSIRLSSAAIPSLPAPPSEGGRSGICTSPVKSFCPCRCGKYPTRQDSPARGSRGSRLRRQAASGGLDSSAQGSFDQTFVAGNSGELSLDNNGSGSGKGGYSKGYGGGNGDGDNDSGESSSGIGNVLAVLTKGWQDRVSADPQFVFKVLTEQIIGVTACVLGDMASRPNFGLNELDFVFCTLVVGSIVNFALMYLLAPTAAAGAVSEALPSIFSRSPAGHMFEAGAYSFVERLGTFVYKGAQFATVGFAAGLMGTAISNGLLAVRKALDPGFVLQNKPPPTLLNAATWALHMGFSSNLRYQCLNGLDQVLLKALSPNAFRGLAFLIRGTNNVIGGSTFVMLAKLTGSQTSAEAAESVKEIEAAPVAS